MSKFAIGKHAYGISDRSGFRYRLKDMRKEWNGLLVGRDEWEEKHPQLQPLRAVPDPQALKNPRPEQNLTEQREIQYGYDPVGFRDIPGITPSNNLTALAKFLSRLDFNFLIPDDSISRIFLPIEIISFSVIFC